MSWAKPPEPPRIAIRYEDHRATLTFKPVPGARGYRLYYAPYPKLRSIRSIELGTKLRFAAALSPEQAYAVAVR